MNRCSPRSLFVVGLVGLVALVFVGLVACVDLTPYPMVGSSDPEEPADAGACEEAAAADDASTAACAEAGP